MTTWADLWDQGTDILAGSDADSPRLDAELLLRFLSGKNKEQFYRDLADPYPADAKNRFHELLSRRAQGMPVAYITGQKEFYGLNFTVNPAVLLPRPETELIVERALELIDRGLLPAGSELLDIGTGSGAIAVALAVNRPALKITATDICGQALAVAVANSRRHGVEGQVTLELADLWPARSGCSAGCRRFGLILSNPPYIASVDLKDLQPEVKAEPVRALDGGPDGLTIYRRLAAGLHQRLLPGGWVLLEVGAGQAAAVSSMLTKNHLITGPPLFDLAGHQRAVQAFLPSP